jgi:hypothetical protein
MPTYGGMSPQPEQYGGGKRLLEYLLESLNRSRGTAYDTSATSNVYPEQQALARTIAAAWGTNQRLANIIDPLRTCLISRWEKIFGFVPLPSDTKPVRRARLVKQWQRFGDIPKPQRIADLLIEELAGVFVAIIHETPTSATTYWPGGTPSPITPWMSTIARISIHVEPLTHMTEAQFYERVGRIFPLLDGRLPAWVTWNWWRNNSLGSQGFLLDDPHNLDNESFDV